MTPAPKKTRLVIRWPSAAVLIAGIAAVAAVFIFVPEHRGDIGLGVAAVFTIALAFMRRVLGVAIAASLALSIAIPSCTPTSKAAWERLLLSAADMALKLGVEAAERELATHGGENP
jgi:hypothetical protein